MKRSIASALAGVALAAAGTMGVAQIKAFTLKEMVLEADQAVHGQIVASRAFRVDHDIDGPELYFTTLTIEGVVVGEGTAVTLDVTYNGGFVSEEEGVFNSEAPIADDVKLGNRVVVFTKWQDNLGGDVAGNALMASHGGLYRTVDGPTDTVVLGRGEGYAIQHNTKVSDLGKAIVDIEQGR
jgi:hypothetical protein